MIFTPRYANITSNTISLEKIECDPSFCIARAYNCQTCQEVFHRDVVGYANILSLNGLGELGLVMPAKPKYLKPYQVLSRSGGHPASCLFAM